LYGLHLQLSRTMDPREWDARRENLQPVIFEKSRQKRDSLRWKFRKLQFHQKFSRRESATQESEKDERVKFIVNKSDHVLSNDEEHLIKNGLKYQPTPKVPPVNDVIAIVETALKYLPNETKASVREGVSTVLGKFSKCNTHRTSGEYEIINNLKKNELVFLEPDKGKGTVVLNRADYREAALKHLEEGPYVREKIRAEFPVDSLQRKVKAGLRKLVRDGLLSEEKSKTLALSNPTIPSFSCFPKTHKEGNKIRPVVANNNSPTSKISEWLVREFKKFKPPESLSVKNSFEVAKEMNGFEIADHEVLISFDVEALFPSVPLEEAFSMCKGWIDSQGISDVEAAKYVGLMELVLSQRVFEFEGLLYKQLEGLFIGNNLSSIITEVFLGRLEIEAKDKAWFPRVWMRYVDDVLAVVERDKIDCVLSGLNNIHPSLKFTSEMESDNSLPFLDLRLIREGPKITIDIYRKPTDAPLCIPKLSHHHFSHKIAAFESYMFRMWNLPLNEERRQKEFHYLKRMAVLNGYETDLVDDIYQKHKSRAELKNITTLVPFRKEKKKSTVDYKGRETTRTAVLPFYGPLTFQIEKVLKSHNINVCYCNRGKLKNLLGVRKKGDDMQASGVYEIPCLDCDERYFGQCGRRIETREKDHDRAIRLKQIERSSVARHCLEQNHRKGAIKLAKRVNNGQYLDAYESMYIANNFDLMNTGEPPISSKLFNFAL